ncbi:PQQ-binding-like beta-propeller repeat protein [Streptomyces sp. NPDC056160]|uniref:outer membrane protein assembly factor BamB family protein n=1 Tax=Streptomyces sp. NPDC056160 TaxID=3345731 RepID=UPI0035DCADD4
MTQPPSQPPQGGFGAPPPQDGASQPQPPQGGGAGAANDPRQATPPPPAHPPQGAPQPPQTAPPAGPPQSQPGYGYPQQPQPGYGYPQQPQPGYGHTRQPGPYGGPGPNAQPGPYAQPGPNAQPGPYGAPAAQGPYGAPGAQGPYGAPGAPAPGPYGPPQQPGPYGQQPGYGYPQPQFPGVPGTPPPGGGSRNPFMNRPALVIGAAVAALAVVGGTVWAVTGGGDGEKKPVAQQSGDAKASGSTGAASNAPVDPGDGSGDGAKDPADLNQGRKAGEARVLWYKEAPDAPGSGAEAPGMWITGKAAVKAAYKQVFAYDVGDGRPAWAPITFPQKICAVTEQKTADDKAVVAYMSGTSDRAKCNQLQQIDLDTGKKGWTATVADGALFDSALTVELSVTGKTLMVGRSQSGVAYNVDTGAKMYEKTKYGQACFPTAFAGGARLVSVASCGAGGASAHDEVQELDPATGKARWTRKIPKGWSVQRTYSVDPLVLYSTDEDKKHWNLSTLNSDGSVRSQADVKGTFAPECGWAILNRELQGCRGVAADAGTLYLPTKATSGPNEIVAVNLATGKEKWRVKSPSDTSMMPLKVENGQLIAYVEPSYDQGGQVVSVAAGGSNHTPVKLLQNPQGTARIENGFFSRDVDWVDGRFYISTTRLNGNDKTKEKLMLAFAK